MSIEEPPEWVAWASLRGFVELLATDQQNKDFANRHLETIRKALGLAPIPTEELFNSKRVNTSAYYEDQDNDKI